MKKQNYWTLVVGFLFAALLSGCQGCEVDPAPSAGEPATPIECPSEPQCEAGTYSCKNESIALSCVLDEQGCPAWQDYQTCENGLLCFNGGCFTEQQIDCPSSCEAGQTYCDREGRVATCEDFDGDGCPELSAENTTTCTGDLWCYGGECVEPVRAEKLELPDQRTEPFVSILSVGSGVYSIDESVTVVPFDAFMAAIKGRYFDDIPTPTKDRERFVDRDENGVHDALDLAIQTTMDGNDLNTLGVVGEYREEGPNGHFEGDVFLVPLDPVISPNQMPLPSVAQGQNVEFKRYFIAVAHGLSGQTPWSVSGARMIGQRQVELPSNQCCGASGPGRMCGPQDPATGPFPEGPCGGEMFDVADCSPLAQEIIDALSQPPNDLYVGGEIDPLRTGTGRTTTDDPTGRTQRLVLRGNGLPAVSMLTFRDRSYHETSRNDDNDTPGYYDPKLLFDHDVLQNPARGPGQVICSHCSKVDCDAGGGGVRPSLSNGLGGTSAGECGSRSNFVPGECQTTGNGLDLPQMCGGVCSGCFGGDEFVDRSIDSCLGFVGGMSGFAQLTSASSSSEPGGCPVAGMPGYCRLADDIDGVCGACDGECQEAVTEAWSSAMGCDAVGSNPECCSIGSSGACACQDVRGVQVCRVCNGNGDCQTLHFPTDDGELFVSYATEEECLLYNYVCGRHVQGGLFYGIIYSNSAGARNDQQSDNDESNSHDPGEQSTPEPSPEKQPKDVPPSPEELKESLAGWEEAVAEIKNQEDHFPEAFEDAKDEREEAPDTPEAVVEEEIESQRPDPDQAPKTASLPSQITDLGGGEPAEEKLDDFSKSDTSADSGGDDGGGGDRDEDHDPIELASGAFLLEQVDLSYPGPVMPLAFVRHYSSQSDDRSILGSNWTHNYDIRVAPIKAESAPSWAPKYCTKNAPLTTCAIVHFPTGAKRLFMLDPGSKSLLGVNAFVPQAGSSDTLYMEADLWVLRRASGATLVFNVFGYMIESRDRFGNGFDITYEPTPIYQLYSRLCRTSEEADAYREYLNFDYRVCSVLGWNVGDKAEPQVSSDGFDTIRSEDGWNVSNIVLPTPSLEFDADYEAFAERTGLSYKERNGRSALQMLLDDQAFAENFFKLGPLPHAVTGERKMRPVEVRDDLGRTIEFTYFSDPSDLETYGLLESIAGPLGSFVEYSYSRPSDTSSWPARLNESFLTNIRRLDAPSTSVGVDPSPERSITLTYNWPSTSSFPSWDEAQIRNDVYERYLEFFATSTGCQLVPNGGGCATTNPSGPVSVCGDDGSDYYVGANTGMNASEHKCAGPGTSVLPGNPVQQAVFQEHGYLSKVADNIVRVELNDTIESENVYQHDPFVSSFDRIVKQRYGGVQSSDYSPDSIARPSTAVSGWVSTLPEVELEYLKAGPVAEEEGAFDRTDVSDFLPEELRVRYALEEMPSTHRVHPCTRDNWAECSKYGPPETDISGLNPNREDFSHATTVCSLNARTFASRRLPGWVADIGYFRMIEPSTTGPKRLVRSRSSCAQLAKAKMSDATHNGLLHRVEVAGEERTWRRIAGERDEIERDLRRICSWTKSRDREGSEVIKGMNFMGLTLVHAQRESSGELLVTEYLYNADGAPLEVRHPTVGEQEWEPEDGYVAYTYERYDPEANEGFNAFVPFWWTRRSNLATMQLHPNKAQRGNSWAHVWNGTSLTGKELAYTETRYFYEPLYNQLMYREEGAGVVNAASGDAMYEPFSSTLYQFDYQEYDRDSQAFCDAISGFARWGYSPFISYKQEEQGEDVTVSCEPSVLEHHFSRLKFYGENLNKDKGFKLVTYAGPTSLEGIGFPNFRGEPIFHIKGLPVRVLSYDFATEKLQSTLIQYAPHGRPKAVIGPDGSRVSFRYYRYQNEETRSESELYGQDTYNGADVSGYHKGLLAQVLTERVDQHYPEEEGPGTELGHQRCDALAGPYQWVIPSGCQGRADAEQKLSEMGIPEDVSQLMFAISDADANSHWSSTRLVYNRGGHTRKVITDDKAAEVRRDSDGRVSRSTDAIGNVTTFERNHHGWPVRVTEVSPGGELVARSLYQYDAEGRVLTACQDVEPGACDTLFVPLMNPHHTLSSGVVAFDAPQQNLTGAPSYLLQTMRYRPEGDLERAMGSDGVEVWHKYNERGLLIATTISPPTVPGVLTPADLIQERAYDHRGNLLHRSFRSSDPSLPAFTERYGRDGFDRIVEKEDIRGTNWFTAFDARSRSVAFKQDVAGARYTDNWVADIDRRESLTQYDGVDASGREVVTSYRSGIERTTVIGSSGRVVQSESTGGAKSWVTYDSLGSPVWTITEDGSMSLVVQDIDLSRDPLNALDTGAQRSMNVSVLVDTRSDQLVRPITSTQTTIATTDVLGRVLSSSRYGVGEDGVVLSQTSSREIDERGLVSSMTNYEGVRTEYVRNLLGWPLEVRMPAPSGSGFDITSHRYDRRGLLTETTDPNGQVISYHYDGFSRVVERTLPMDRAQSYERNVFDGLGRLKESIQRPGQPEQEVLRYEYDMRGDMVRTSWIDSAAQDRTLQTYSYDDLGRVIEAAHFNPQLADLGLTREIVVQSSQFDALDRQTSHTTEFFDMITAPDPWRSYTTEYDYQVLGSGKDASWQHGVTYPSGTRWDHDYDRHGRLTTLRHGSQLIEQHWLGGASRGSDHFFDMTSDPLTKRREFDGLMRPIRLGYSAVEVNASSQPVNPSWGAEYCVGTWDTACASALFEVDLLYDVMNRIVAKRHGFGHPVLDDTGQHRALADRRQSWRGYGYNAQGHLEREIHRDGVSEAEWNTLANHDLMDADLDPLKVGGQTWLWNREEHVGSLQEVVLESDPTRARWAHVDATSGQLSARLPGYRLDGVGLDGQTFSIEHDEHGRVTKDPRFHYVYDVQNRLIGVRDVITQDLLEAYIYDARGRMVRRWTNTSDGELYVYDGTQMIAAYDEADTLIWEAAWSSGIDQLLSWSDSTGRVYLPLRDERNSVVGLWDTQDKKLVGLTEYDAFGRLTVLDENEQVICRENAASEPVCEAMVDFPFAFNTQWRSQLTGLYAMRNRWYSAELGQFVSLDPLGAIDSFDMYAFARFDPINRWDPLGLSSDDHFSTSDKVLLGIDDLAQSLGELNKQLTDDMEKAIQPNDKDEGLSLYGKAAGVAAVEVYRTLTPQSGDQVLEEVIMTVGTLGLGKAVTSLQKGGRKAVNSLRKYAKKTLKKSRSGSKKASQTVDNTKDTKKQNKSDSKCKNGACPGGKCFAPGTMVLMADGSTRAIEELEPGDWVLADNPEDEEAARPQQVLTVLTNYTHRLVMVEVIDDDGEVGQIESTGKHLFFTAAEGWKTADALERGDLLLDDEERWVEVVSASSRSVNSPTHNLIVEQDFTFFVVAGNAPVLVDSGKDLVGSHTRDYMAFVQGTLIHTMRGVVPIEQLHPQDLVISRDERTGEYAAQPIFALGESVAQRFYYITIDVGEEREELFAHPTQRFWIEGRGWDQIENAASEDVVVTRAGYGRVVGVGSIKLDSPVRTFAFEVRDVHSYLVGGVGVWVHNTDDMSPLAQTVSQWSPDPSKRTMKKYSMEVTKFKQRSSNKHVYNIEVKLYDDNGVKQGYVKAEYNADKQRLWIENTEVKDAARRQGFSTELFQKLILDVERRSDLPGIKTLGGNFAHTNLELFDEAGVKNTAWARSMDKLGIKHHSMDTDNAIVESRFCP